MPSDFDGDGYSDAAVAVPGEDINGVRDAGSVLVFRGGAAGLSPSSTVLTMTSLDVNGGNVSGGRFGEALASGDFNGDGCADLAIGAPGDSRGNVFAPYWDGRRRHDGAVSVLYGGIRGLTEEGRQRLTAPRLGAYGYASFEDSYVDCDPGHCAVATAGYAVASGDFDADGYDDLVTQMSGGEVTSTVDGRRTGGWPLAVTFGGPRGLVVRSTVLVDASAPGFPTDQRVHQFGIEFDVADVDGDGRDELVSALVHSGEFVLASVPIRRGVGPGRARLWGYGSPGVVGTGMGRYLEQVITGDFNADGVGDAALCTGDEFGQAEVLVGYGSPVGLNSGSAAVLPALTFPAPRAPGFGAGYPEALVAGDLNGDGDDELVVAARNRNDVVVVAGSSASGLRPATATGFSQDTPGMPGGTELYDGWGAVLAVGEYGRRGGADLLVGAPGEDLGGGAVTAIFGSTDSEVGLTAAGAQRFTQATPGVIGAHEPSDQFGRALG